MLKYTISADIQKIKIYKEGNFMTKAVRRLLEKAHFAKGDGWNSSMLN